jgi:D-3-phosphoglycerate dehydrogenase
MEKVLFILDYLPEEFVTEDPEMCRILKSLGDDVEIKFYQDMTMFELDNPMAYIGKVEEEGVEWVEPAEELLELLKDTDAVLLQWSPFNSKMVDAAPNLKFIGSMRSGFDNISAKYAEDKGIVVRNCPGRLANAVADHTIALILSENRGLLRINLRGTNGEWTTDMSDDPFKRPLCMQTAGLVGFGIIAQETAKRLQGFGTKVIAYDPWVSDEVFEQAGVEKVDLETLLKESDIVSIHARLTDETRNLIGEEQLAMMKPGAMFINTARAGLVDEKALIRALKEERIAAAGLDVYSEEPFPEDFPLLTMDNVTLTPHSAGSFAGNMQLSLSMIVNTFKKFLAGEEV